MTTWTYERHSHLYRDRQQDRAERRDERRSLWFVWTDPRDQLRLDGDRHLRPLLFGLQRCAPTAGGRQGRRVQPRAIRALPTSRPTRTATRTSSGRTRSGTSDIYVRVIGYTGFLNYAANRVVICNAARPSSSNPASRGRSGEPLLRRMVGLPGRGPGHLRRQFLFVLDLAAVGCERHRGLQRGRPVPERDAVDTAASRAPVGRPAPRLDRERPVRAEARPDRRGQWGSGGLPIPRRERQRGPSGGGRQSGQHADRGATRVRTSPMPTPQRISRASALPVGDQRGGRRLGSSSAVQRVGRPGRQRQCVPRVGRLLPTRPGAAACRSSTNGATPARVR